MKRLTRFLYILTLAVVLVPSTVSALSQDQANVLNSGAYYYDTDVASGACAYSQTSGSNSVQSGSVYFVGDSIGNRTKDELQSSFSAKGWGLNADVLDSRNLVGAPPTPDGLGAIKQDADKIKSASAVVVELGTNAGGFTAANVGTVIDKVKSINANAPIYWVDTAVVSRPGYVPTLDRVNQIIYAQSGPKQFKVISWNKAVFGSDADPQNIDPAAKANGLIDTSDGVNVHPTPEGSKVFADTVVSNVAGSNPVVDTSCSCSQSGFTPVTGSTNAEQAWNFFKSQGLGDKQTAAILGNLRRESGINPRRVQNTPTPQGDSDINPLDGKTGYGIAQWTALPRQQALSAYAAQTNRPVSSLDLQLNFIYKEMTAGPVWNNLQSINDIRAATIYVESSYENSADTVGSSGMEDRINGAIKYYNLYSGTTSPLPGSPTPVCAPGGGIGPGTACTTGNIIGWSLNGDCRMVSYDQGDARWANIPYGKGKTPISESGCGPTSLAMVGATLLSDTSITPATVATKYGDQYHGPEGTDWSLFPKYAQDTGLKYKDLGTDFNAAAEIIRGGGLVVIAVNPGYFTSSGHIMVIRAITPDGTGFYLADPSGTGKNGDSETRAFSAAFLLGQGSMKNMWGYYK